MEDLSSEPQVERELMLIKVYADTNYLAEVGSHTPIPIPCVEAFLFRIFLFFVSNLQIKWLVNIFRAKIVDISDHSVTIEVMI